MTSQQPQSPADGELKQQLQQIYLDYHEGKRPLSVYINAVNELLNAYILAQVLELTSTAREDRYESHKLCKHNTDTKWGAAYSDACFDIEAEAQARFGSTP